MDNKFISIIKKINEEWATEVKTSYGAKTSYPIFYFPLTQKEINELLNKNIAYEKFSRVFRFIIDNEKKKVYIFPQELLHSDADIALKIYKYNSFRSEASKQHIYGYAEYSNKTKKFSTKLSIPEDWDYAIKYLKK